MSDKIFVVVQYTNQSEYTEPKYWIAANDSSEILCASFDKEEAEAYAAELNKAEEQEKHDEDDPVLTYGVEEVPILKKGDENHE